MKEKETVLVLDDDTLIANALCDTLQNNGFRAIDANSIEEARQKLAKERADILVFDIGLDKRDLSITSIDFAISLNEARPLPTLFYTHYSSREVPDFFEATRRIKHSTWSARKGTDWDSDILNGITLAKEKFLLTRYDEMPSIISDIPFKDRITFREWRGGQVPRDEVPARRLFLKKEDILFITSNSNRKHTLFREAFEPHGEYSVFFTKGGRYFRFGATLGPILEQLEHYAAIGWNFRRIHRSYIINMDYLESYNTDDQTVQLSYCEFSIPVGDGYFKDSDSSDLFPFLGAG